MRCILYIHTMYIHTHILVYCSVCMFSYFSYVHTYVHTCMHACMHACMLTYIHTYIHTYMHTYIHTCMHTLIHALLFFCMLPCLSTTYLEPCPMSSNYVLISSRPHTTYHHLEIHGVYSCIRTKTYGTSSSRSA